MQTIVTKCHAATNTRGRRYSATSSGGLRISIRENPEWTNSDTGHTEAVRALQNKIGNRWPDSPMIGGALNERGDMVWVFLDERSPRITGSNAP